MKFSVLCVLSVLSGLAGLLSAGPVSAGNIHDLFEARCGTCHEHAGDLARNKLALTPDGQLVGRESKRRMKAFLNRHHARDHEKGDVAALVALFTRQVQAGGVFKDKCRACHDPAHTLARIRLVFVNGRLVGRYSGVDMADFLLGHGRTSEKEREILLRTLVEMAPKRD